MLRWVSRRRDQVERLLRDLEGVRPGGYTEADRSRDFREVFGSEAGKRVLREIVDMSDKPVTENDLGKSGRLEYRAGMRATGLMIIATMTKETRTQPTTTTKLEK